MTKKISEDVIEKKKLSDDEIISALQQATSNTLTLAELFKEINEYRDKKKQQPVGKTTIYDHAKHLIKEEIIQFSAGKGYFISSNWDEGKKNIEKYLSLFQYLSKQRIYIYLEKKNIRSEKKLDQNNQDLMKQLSENKDLLLRYELIYRHPDEDNMITLSYRAARLLNVCPICYQKVESTKVHIKLILIDSISEVIAYELKTHLKCAHAVYYRQKISLSTNIFDKIKHFFTWDNYSGFKSNLSESCEYCGLPLNIFQLCSEFNQSISLLDRTNFETIEKKTYRFYKSMSKDLIMELYGDLNSLIWGTIGEVKISGDIYYVLSEKVIEDDLGFRYHPECIKKGGK
ncbi:hypothetical protein DSAG12_02657 [Promethearchaeum syntrophicum]|uniref:Uncharacterized protein n=1 Tax=Promethearchaeum syntrophicum TaxID=2594042 RepID=A0A5B9DD75_9ARCH|nr:hypothetical protein [Candidatus Prometheoarchaeum syntrophicum]QEE16827.1 hypothetical protein DSAG12_02657 [Candidatus Prometheoarchaeum syntrophicum]